MRIVSGIFRGRQIVPPKNLPVRPTMDISRDSFFNILNSVYYFENLTFLDLFSGTGMMSYEAISRGFKKVVAVEIDNRCYRFISGQFREFQAGQARVVRADALKFLQTIEDQFDIVYADPPYQYPDYSKIPELVFERKILHPDGILALEHSTGLDFSGHAFFYQQRKYGQSIISFFKITV
jgi:16S rRNA (guanine(966)-N(2))-methyltransferase RsmD